MSWDATDYMTMPEATSALLGDLAESIDAEAEVKYRLIEGGAGGYWPTMHETLAYLYARGLLREADIREHLADAPDWRGLDPEKVRADMHAVLTGGAR